MGKECKNVVRVHNESTETVVGTWEDGRIGTFRGTRTGKHEWCICDSGKCTRESPKILK